MNTERILIDTYALLRKAYPTMNVRMDVDNPTKGSYQTGTNSAKEMVVTIRNGNVQVRAADAVTTCKFNKAVGV